jgi:hypothetical protein
MQLKILNCSRDGLGRLLSIFLLFLPLSIAAAEEWIYTVRPGDNLWNLTQRHLTSIGYVQKLQQLNDIQNPYALTPGTQLRIPVAWTKSLHEALARVIDVQGTAIRQNEHRESVPVKVGMQLFVNDEIRSENDAFVTIEFSDGSRLRVQENTYLRLKDMRIWGDHGSVDTLIDLQEGRTEGLVPKKSDTNTRFRIKTPSAISLIRGTDFRVGAIDARSSRSDEVISGVVEVSSGKGKVKISGGYGTVTFPDMPPVPPVKLLPPPDLSETVNYYQNLPLVIKLKPSVGAHAYRAQIATDRDFRNLLSEFTTQNLPFRDGDIPDGNYWLRVRGIDRSGIEGRDATIPFALNARPEVPFIIEPLPGGVTEPETQEFKWAIQSEASHYAIMISQDPDFSRMVYFNPEVKENTLTLSESLAPGHYFWRIFSVSADEGAGPLSDPMPFRVPYPSPTLKDTKLNEKDITFAWQAAAEGQSFHFQFSRDKAFTDIIHDEQTIASQVTLVKPDGGTYYLRIKTIESDGFQGPWGSPQVIEIPREQSLWFMLLMLLPLLVLL